MFQLFLQDDFHIPRPAVASISGTMPVTGYSSWPLAQGNDDAGMAYTYATR